METKKIIGHSVGDAMVRDSKAKDLTQLVCISYVECGLWINLLQVMLWYNLPNGQSIPKRLATVQKELLTYALLDSHFELLHKA